MHNVWPYIVGAYAVTGVGLIALTLGVVLHLMRWARKAREESAL